MKKIGQLILCLVLAVAMVFGVAACGDKEETPGGNTPGGDTPGGDTPGGDPEPVVLTKTQVLAKAVDQLLNKSMTLDAAINFGGLPLSGQIKLAPNDLGSFDYSLSMMDELIVAQKDNWSYTTGGEGEYYAEQTAPDDMPAGDLTQITEGDISPMIGSLLKLAESINPDFVTLLKEEGGYKLGFSTDFAPFLNQTLAFINDAMNEGYTIEQGIDALVGTEGFTGMIFTALTTFVNANADKTLTEVIASFDAMTKTMGLPSVKDILSDLDNFVKMMKPQIAEIDCENIYQVLSLVLSGARQPAGDEFAAINSFETLMASESYAAVATGERKAIGSITLLEAIQSFTFRDAFINKPNDAILEYDSFAIDADEVVASLNLFRENRLQGVYIADMLMSMPFYSAIENMLDPESPTNFKKLLVEASFETDNDGGLKAIGFGIDIDIENMPTQVQDPVTQETNLTYEPLVIAVSAEMTVSDLDKTTVSVPNNIVYGKNYYVYPAILDSADEIPDTLDFPVKITTEETEIVQEIWAGTFDENVGKFAAEDYTDTIDAELNPDMTKVSLSCNFELHQTTVADILMENDYMLVSFMTMDETSVANLIIVSNPVYVTEIMSSTIDGLKTSAGPGPDVPTGQAYTKVELVDDGHGPWADVSADVLNNINNAEIYYFDTTSISFYPVADPTQYISAEGYVMPETRFNTADAFIVAVFTLNGQDAYVYIGTAEILEMGALNELGEMIPFGELTGEGEFAFQFGEEPTLNPDPPATGDTYDKTVFEDRGNGLEAFLPGESDYTAADVVVYRFDLTAMTYEDITGDACYSISGDVLTPNDGFVTDSQFLLIAVPDGEYKFYVYVGTANTIGSYFNKTFEELMAAFTAPAPAPAPVAFAVAA